MLSDRPKLDITHVDSKKAEITRRLAFLPILVKPLGII
jgi:hypothetical protein